MSSSRNILRGTPQPFGSFLERLQTVHQVSEESPAAQWTRAEIQRRFHQAHEEGHLVGYSDGYAKGEAKGLEVGLATGQSVALQNWEDTHREEIDLFTHSLAQVVEDTKAGVDAWYREAEERLAILAIEIARRAIGQELAIREDAVADIAKQVLSEVTSGTQVRVRVSPLQVPALEARRTELLAALSHVRDLEVVSDPSIRNGCVVESEGGVVDARIESYLHRLAEETTGEAA